MAQNKHQSLSSLIERLLNDEIEKDSNSKLALIGELHGIAGKVPENTDWKDVIRNSANEKHGKLGLYNPKHQRLSKRRR